MYSTKSALLKKLQHYCAYQDRCQAEVSRKLFELGTDRETADEIFMELIQEGYLNEERYARSFVRGKFRMNHWGRIKIISRLRFNGVSEPLIQISLTEIDEAAYLDQIRSLLSKIHSEKSNVHKTIQAVIAKGFETELVFEQAGALKLKDSE